MVFFPGYWRSAEKTFFLDYQTSNPFINTKLSSEKLENINRSKPLLLNIIKYYVFQLFILSEFGFLQGK